MAFVSFIDNTQIEQPVAYIDNRAVEVPPENTDRSSIVFTNTATTTESVSVDTFATSIYSNATMAQTGDKVTFNAGVFTIHSDGLYYLQFSVQTSGPTSAYNGIRVFRNGAYLCGSRNKKTNSAAFTHQITQLCVLNANDTLQLKLCTDGGVSLNFSFLNDHQWMIMQFFKI